MRKESRMLKDNRMGNRTLNAHELGRDMTGVSQASGLMQLP